LKKNNAGNAAKAGDVFLIPADSTRGYLSVVVAERNASLYVLVYDQVVPWNGEENAHDWNFQVDPLFAALTFDARFHHGDWKIIGQTNPEPDRFLPAFCYGSPETGGARISNFTGTTSRSASPADIQTIRPEVYRSPMLLERAVRAQAGLESWYPVFDEIRYAKTPTSADLFGS